MLPVAIALSTVLMGPPTAETAGPRSIPPSDASQRWLRRWAPEPHMLELGLLAGGMVVHPRLALSHPLVRWRQTAANGAIRFGYMPLRFLGVEVEAGVIGLRTAGNDGGFDVVRVGEFGGHLVGQVGLSNFVPFVLIGPAALVDTDDVDASLHFGAGLKFYVTRWIALRLEARDLVAFKLQSAAANSDAQDFGAHNLQITTGIAVTFRRSRQR